MNVRCPHHVRLLSGVLAATVAGASAPTAAGAELQWDFTGGRFSHEHLQLLSAGGDTTALVRLTPAGLRITLPLRSTPPIGVATRFELQGDFEVTGRYEILSVERPRGGYGVGPRIYLKLRSPSQEACSIARLERVEEGSVYLAHRAHTDDSAQRHQEHAFTETEVRAGRLRLKRTGNRLEYLVADSDSDAFHKLHEIECGTEDVETVDFRGHAGDSAAPLDMLWKDIEIRADAFSMPQPRSSASISFYLWVGLGIVGAGVVAAIAVWRSRRGR